MYIPSIFAINRTDEQFIWITKFQLKSCTATRTPWLAQGLFPNTPWDWLQVNTLWTRTLTSWQRPLQRIPIRLPWHSLECYSEMQDQNRMGQGENSENCTGVEGVDLEAHTHTVYTYLLHNFNKYFPNYYQLWQHTLHLSVQTFQSGKSLNNL